MTTKDFIRFVNDNTMENITNVVLENDLLDGCSRVETLHLAKGVKEKNFLSISMLMLREMEVSNASKTFHE